MDSNPIPDPNTPFGARVLARLRDDAVVWLTTVGDDGTPQPNPVWFLWDGQSFVVYNRPDAQRLRHIRTRPRVALSFDGDGRGGDIVVVTGSAELSEGEPPTHEVPAYLSKYGQRMTQIAGSPEGFSHAYPVPLRIHPTRVRGH
jgi:PPOX class probable F420-dependent enzyme